MIPDSVTVMKVLNRFRFFLTSSWPVINELLIEHDWDDDAYFVEDWIDANWKLLVCRQLFIKDADFQPFPISANEAVKNRYSYQLRSKMDEDKVFISIGSDQNGFSISPPFDRVMLCDLSGNIQIIPWSDVEFKIATSSA